MRARGLMYGLLILIAIAVGVLASGLPMRKSDGKLAVNGEAPSPSTAASTSTSTAARSTPSTSVPATTAPATTSPTTASHAPGDIDVLVANASGVNNAASTRAAAIKTSGYNTLVSVDATDMSASSRVFYVSGFKNEALAIAETLGIGVEAVKPMAKTPPVADLKTAKVLAVIGTDLAGPPPS
jgi:LytR cell envelope-related transcriptional attenuator